MNMDNMSDMDQDLGLNEDRLTNMIIHRETMNRNFKKVSNLMDLMEGAEDEEKLQHDLNLVKEIE